MFRTTRAKLLTSAVIVVATAGIALASTSLLGLTFQGTERREGLLLTSNRDHLAICVDAVDVESSQAAVATERIQGLLPVFENHPNWSRGGLGAAPPTVDTACPSAAAIARPGAHISDRGPKGLDVFGPGVVVENPSLYRLFVFLISPGRFSSLFTGGNPLVGQEYRRLSSDSYAGVTTAMYVTLDQLNNDAYLLEWLGKAIGLDPVFPLD